MKKVEKEKKELSFQKVRLIIVMVSSLVVLAFLLGTFVGASFRISKDTKTIKTFNEEKIKDTKPVKDTDKIDEEYEDDEEEIEEPEESEETEEPEEVAEVVELPEETIDEQIEFFLRALPSKYTNKKAEDLTNQEKLYLVYQKINSAYYEKNIPQSVIEEKMKDLFGQNVTYEDEDIYALDIPTEMFAKYDSITNTYKQTNLDGRDSCFETENMHHIISSTTVNNTLTVRTKVLYYPGCTGPGPLSDVYKDPELKQKITVPEKYCDKSMSTDFCAIGDEERFIKDMSNSLRTLTFVFEKNNNILSFKEIH